jgi:hypothetical protein
MNVPPACQQVVKLLDDNPHCAANVAALHAFNGHNLKHAINAKQVYLGVTIAEHMDMRRLVIINENNDVETICSMDRDHGRE